MKSIVSYACILSVLIAGTMAAPLGSPFFQLGGNSTGPSLTEALSSLDIPALLKTINSGVKFVGVFCPPCSQILDNVIQNVTTQAFRIFGRAILRNGLGGGGGQSGGDAGGGSRVSVVLPTYPPDDDEDYEDEEDSSPAETNVDLSSTTVASPANEENTVAKRHTRVVREAGEDQDGAESAPEPNEDLSNIEDDDADRNKRWSPFGGALGGHGGGSGNFLFDIIRLVAGSGATEESDEKAGPGGVAEVDVSKAVGQDISHGEGIPGPITRLFVVANRGLANLIQDLILRLAQTSERIVNFKARLVTSLI